jgi:hypothetical protein
MKLSGLVVVGANCLVGIAGLAALTVCAQAATAPAAHTPSQWEPSAAALADQIAEILGPGQARLTIRNQSTIAADEIPAIRKLLEEDLKTHGVLASGAESANLIRVTLSKDWLDGLWVAEVVEGNQTRVAMVRAGLTREISSGATQQKIILSVVSLWSMRGVIPPFPFPILDNPRILAAVDTNSGLVVLDEDRISIYARGFSGLSWQKGFEVPWRLPLNRDSRGLLLPTEDGNGFVAYGPGLECMGSYTQRTDNSGKYGDWSIKCHETDDPWPIVQQETAGNSIKAFYNAARNYSTGIVAPSLGLDLPPFYSAALLPRPASGAALLIGGIDGKIQLTETETLKPVSGTRDWGSDFAALHSGCGTGTQIVASGSGEAIADSLRAYELPAQEAIPASAPLAMEGTVTALWTAPDGKSVLAIVRKRGNQGAGNEYEVDRVTASCN